MNTLPRRAGAWLAAFLLCLLATGPVPALQDGPLTDEDIVRGFVSGRSADELVALIEGSAVAFDLDPEMLRELRAAGLPGKVIEAMQRRQKEMDRASAPPEEEEGPEEALAAGARPGLSVVLNPDATPPSERDAEAEARAAPKADDDSTADDTRILRFLDVIPPSLHATLGLDAEDRRFTDAAIFLGCTRTQHVPDHWRSKTPLGRDFVNAPRHRLLAWSTGARTLDSGKLSKLLGKFSAGPDQPEIAILELDIPPQLDAEVEPGDTHDLILGIALQAGGRFFAITVDAWDGVALDGPLTATVRSGGSLRSPRMDVHFNRGTRHPDDEANDE